MSDPLGASAGIAAPPPWERLDRRVVAYWYLTDLLSAIVFGGLLVGGLFWFRQPMRDWFAVASWAVAGVTGLLFVSALVSPPLAFVCWAFAADGDLLRMRYGILFREERAVPVRRMQHVDLMRGPIERLFGLATLVVFTAGNEGSAFRVPGLPVERAKALRDRILAARGDDVL